MVHDILSWCAIHLLSGVSTLGASRRLQESPPTAPSSSRAGSGDMYYLTDRFLNVGTAGCQSRVEW